MTEKEKQKNRIFFFFLKKHNDDHKGNIIKSSFRNGYL